MSMNESQDTHDLVQHWRRLQSLLRGYRQSQVLICATQLGVFRALAEGPLTVDELARRVEANPNALRRLLAAAVALDLLQKDGERYANAPMARACLARDGRFYLGNLVAREADFYRRWRYLLQTVRSGERAPQSEGDEEDLSGVRDFELGLLDLARVSAPAIAEALPVPEERPARVLDAGGGHGYFSIALARRYPQLQAVVFELPAAAEVAREVIAAEEMGERVRVQVGDFQQEDLGRNYDLILLFGVLGSESREGKLALLRKTHAALSPGGAVAIRGFAANPATEDEAPDLDEALFSLHLLLFTAAGDSPTLAELSDSLLHSGFRDPKVLPLPEWIGSQVLVARKAGS